MINLTPHAKAQHWSAEYVGLPWSEDFNCWHLVRKVQLERFGREMPALDINMDPSTENWQALTDLLVHSVWRPAEGVPREGDVLLMRGPRGPHVGVIVYPGVRPELLHNDGIELPDGTASGSTTIAPVSDLPKLKYGRFKLWRAA